MPQINEPLEFILPSGRRAYYNPYSDSYSYQRGGRTFFYTRDYAERMQRNYTRDIRRQEARGHRAAPGTTEASTRRQRFAERYEVGYYQWRRWQRQYISEINLRSYPQAPSRTMIVDENGIRRDPRIFLVDALAVKHLYDSGFRDPNSLAITWQGWFEERLRERLNALIDYQDLHIRQTGHDQYNRRTTIWFGQFATSTGPPIELWYYH